MPYVIISFVVFVFSGFVYFFPKFYVSELGLSFLPYGIIILFVGLVLSLIYTKKYLRAKKANQSFPWYQWFAGLFAIAFGVLFLLYSSMFTSFYENTLPKHEVSTGSVKVLFANIHKDNRDYTWIEQLITKENPDMLMFVEFADHHYTAMKSFLQTYYPYSNSTTRSKTFVGSMVFSKQKIENRADDFPQGMRRYGYFSLLLGGKNYYFYLVHTSSPDSYQHFVMRNEQLQTLEKDFYTHEKSRKHDNVVVVGDFNITPWSVYYKWLQSAFSGVLTNVTKQFPVLFTRNLRKLPFVEAHIDHLRVSSGVTVTDLRSVVMPGSDHKAYLFDIK